jgi:TonB family protein
MTAVASQGKARPSSLRHVFATLVAVGALALIWAGARMLREQQSAPPPPPAAEVAQDVIEEPATPIPPPIEGPPPVAATAQPAVDGNIAEPAEPDEEAVSASQIHEEIPQIPSRARQTIRGSVKVSVRVIVDPDGTVFAALSDDRGPSRYFERLAIDAAKKWTFTPMNNGAQRLVLLRFEFTRNGTTARAVPLR